MIETERIIQCVRALPSLPAVVVELLATMEQDDIDTQALAAKITLDQALTAKTLRLANSSFYGMSSRVTSIQQAITVLGFHSIRTLVTACALTAGFRPAPGSDFDFEDFWRHAIASAACARVLAPRLRVNRDTAFTAGLLHDLGTLVLVTGFPEQYQGVSAWRREHDCDSAEAQLAVFGTDHAMVGSALAAHWKFPPQIQAAVAAHHQPEAAVAALTANPAAPGLGALIYLANLLAHALLLEGRQDQQPAALPLASPLPPPLPLLLPPPVWQALQLSGSDWDGVLTEAEQLFADLCRTLAP